MARKPGSENFIRTLYQRLFGRQPNELELERWVRLAEESNDWGDILNRFCNSTESKFQAVTSRYPNGHFYSPVVDPKQVRTYCEKQFLLNYSDLPGLKINAEAMLEFWNDNIDVILSTPFTDEPNPANRFYYRDAPYPYGDAMILRAMIARHRPKRIIEIGSGFTSACMLDCADQFGLAEMELTCIDPNMGRLRKLLRPSDAQRVTIVEKQVQDVPVEFFACLSDGDFLFIDSSHVLKTGSDVHYELFSILPNLNKGVLIHFHDILYRFEYNRKLIYQLNYSWNEVYALRAFLMYNDVFEVYLWNVVILKAFPEVITAQSANFARNPGSGIWLIKQK